MGTAATSQPPKGQKPPYVRLEVGGIDWAAPAPTSQGVAAKVSWMSAKFSTREVSGDLGVQGQWWLPDDEENRVGGALDFRRGEGGDLRLSGALRTDSDLMREQTLLGHTDDGQRVTLADAYETRRRMTVFDQTLTAQTWRCHTAFVGAHLPEGATTRFDGASLTTAHVAAWSGEARARIERPDDGKRVSIEVNIPETLSATSELGAIELSWSPRMRQGSLDAEVTLEPSFIVRAKESTLFDDLWHGFTVPLLFFLTLCTGEPNALGRMSVWSGQPSEREPYVQADVLTSTWAAPVGSEAGR